MATPWAFGRDRLDLGPGTLYAKPVTVSAWNIPTGYIDLGKTNGITFRNTTSKTDLTAIQDGARPSDRVITAQQVQFETGIGAPYVERLENLVQGLEVEKDTAGNVTRIMITDKIGQRDSDALLWVKFIPIRDGVLSTDELDIVYTLAAPSTDSIEQVFDAESQRYWPIMFEAYKNDDAVNGVQDSQGRYAYLWTAVKVIA